MTNISCQKIETTKLPRFWYGSKTNKPMIIWKNIDWQNGMLVELNHKEIWGMCVRIVDDVTCHTPKFSSRAKL